MLFTNEEHIENLNRLNIDNYDELVGKEVYYTKPSYGVHKVLSFDAENEEYLLSLHGVNFKSNPFRIKLIK